MAISDWFPFGKKETAQKEGKSPIEPIEVDTQPLIGLYRSRSSKTTIIIKTEGKGITMTIRGFGGDYGEHHLFHPVSIHGLDVVYWFLSWELR